MAREIENGGCENFLTDVYHVFWLMNPSLATQEFPYDFPNCKGFYAIIDNDVFMFFGPKPHNFPEIPSRETWNPSAHVLELPNFFIPSWLEPTLPFLGFAPSSNPFKNRFLQCLDFSPQAIPIEKLSNNKYALERSLQIQWDALEQTLRVFVRACHNLCPKVFDEGFRFWAYPRQFGYSRAWHREEIARKAASNSRSAFLPLLASIALMLHVLHCHEAEFKKFVGVPPVPIPQSSFLSLRQNQVVQWRNEPVTRDWNLWERLRERTTISSEFLHYLDEIVQISPVGLFIDIRNFDAPTLLPILLKNPHLPVALYLGNVNNWSWRSISLNSLPLPDEAQVQYLKKSQRPYSPPSLVPFPCQVSLGPGSPVHLPPSMQSFFEQRVQNRALVIASETDRGRLSRLDRERHASKNLCPGQAGSRVYLWELDEGRRIRRSVGRGFQQQIWLGYSSNQHCYDSVANEWDLCSLFAPGEAADDEDDEFQCYRRDPLDDKEISLPDNGSGLAEGFLNRNASSASDDRSIQFLDAIDDIVFHQFGYIGTSCSDGQLFSQEV